MKVKSTCADCGNKVIVRVIDGMKLCACCAREYRAWQREQEEPANVRNGQVSEEIA